MFGWPSTDKRMRADGQTSEVLTRSASGAPANELRGLVGGAKSVKTDWGEGH
jgi:hypothetical protein